MITSRQILSLSEDYFDSKNVNGQLVTIFENPSASEFRELERDSRKSGGGNVLRCIADAKTQKVYVWDAYNARHVDIRTSVLHLPASYDQSPNTIDAYVEVSGGKAKMFAWEDLQFYLVKYKTQKSAKLDRHFATVFSNRWTWLDRYIDSTRFIMNLQLEFEDKLMGF